MLLLCSVYAEAACDVELLMCAVAVAADAACDV